MDHALAIGAVYSGVTCSRILKGCAAFGVGGVSNTYLREKIRERGTECGRAQWRCRASFATRQIKFDARTGRKTK